MKLGILTDSHVIASGSRVAAAIAAFNDWGADLIFELGDNVNAFVATEAEIIAQYDVYRAAIAGAAKPVYSVFGNNGYYYGPSGDYYEASHLLASIALWEAKTGMTNNYYSFDSGGFHFIVLSNCIAGDGETPLDWLTADLAANVLPAIVLSHLPMRPWPGYETAYINPLTRTILGADGKTIAYFGGHIHQDLYIQDGAAFFSLKDMYAQGAYSKVTIDDNRNITLEGFQDQGNVVMVRAQADTRRYLALAADTKPTPPSGSGIWVSDTQGEYLFDGTNWQLDKRVKR